MFSRIGSCRSTYALAANETQDSLTPAGDGIQNLLKYAFNMMGTGTAQAPLLATPNITVPIPTVSAGLPLVDLESAGNLRVNYVRRKATSNPGISYEVQISDDLVTWAVNPSVTTVVTNIDATFKRVLVTDGGISPTKRFVRIRVNAL